jgi:hypothetical protein
MRILFWAVALAVLALALSVPLTARAAELSAPAVGSYERGLAALERGDLDAARSHLAAGPRSDPRHADAMRRLGREVLADGRGDARAGVGYLDRALLADPFSGAVWRDWALVHLRLVGLGRERE